MSEIVECDVLVAGSGAGGLSAAIVVDSEGLDVVVAEKEPTFGGTTAYSAGVVWIPLNAHAKRIGMPDSREAALAYLEAEIGNRLDRAKAEAFVDEAARMLDFFERETHVRYSLQPTWADYHPDKPGGSQGARSLLPEPYDGRLLGDRFAELRAPIRTMMAFGGMMVGRDDIPHMFRVTRSARSALHVSKLLARYAVDRLKHPRGTRLANGNALVARLVRTLLDRKIPLWLRSPVVELLVEGGRVAGAVVEREGVRTTVRARRAVVLACGGFPGSAEMRARFYGHVQAGKTHQPLAPSTNTGDGIRLAEGVGAAFVDDPHHPAAWTPTSLVPQADGSVVPYPHFIDRGKPGFVSVDRRGKRFVNEALSYHDYVPAMIEACKDDPEVEAWVVCDHRAVKLFGIGAVGPAPTRLGPYLRSGYLKRGETPEALARAAGIDPHGLAATLARYNEHAARGEDPDFAKGTDAYQRFNGAASHKPNPCVAPLNQGPYYAVRVIPGDIGTFAGLRTDRDARVLDRDGRPIAGLYAVGNDQASVMGGTYPGAGITLGPAMTFAWIAARHIAGAGR